MSLENDLKLEIKQNKEYIHNLIEENQHLTDMMNSFKKRQIKEESIIPSLRAKMKKYYDLYNSQVEKLNLLQRENKEYKDEVWTMRDEYKKLQEKYDLEVEEKTKLLRAATEAVETDDSEKLLRIENEQLLQKVDLLNSKVMQLEDEIFNIKKTHAMDQSSRRVSMKSNYNGSFLRDSSHISNDFNDTNLLFRQADEYIKKPPVTEPEIEKEKDLIEELEGVLKIYERKFDEEDAKKKRIDDTFKLFEKIKQRMVSEERTPVKESVPETPNKLNKLEQQVETISETLSKLMVTKEPRAKKRVQSSTIKKFPRLDLDDVSVNDSQMDVLGQRRSSAVDQTQVKHNIFSENILRNVSNATSRTLNSVRNGLDEAASKSDDVPIDADMDTLNKISAEYEGREVNIDDIVNGH